MTCIEDRNLSAESRAVEEGHRALLGDEDRTFKVVSDTYHGKHYLVRYDHAGTGRGIMFGCEPVGDRCYADDHLQIRSQVEGHTPCKHAALVARRMERDGLAEWSEGRWLATDLCPRRTPEPISAEDLFAMLQE